MHMAAAQDGGVLATISEDGVMLLSSLALLTALRGPTVQAGPAAMQQPPVRHQLQVCLMEEQAVQSLLDHITELKAQVRCCERSSSAGLGLSNLLWDTLAMRQQMGLPHLPAGYAAHAGMLSAPRRKEQPARACPRVGREMTCFQLPLSVSPASFSRCLLVQIKTVRSDYEYKLMMQPKQLNEQLRDLRGKAAKLEEAVAARELENARLQEVRSRSLLVSSMLRRVPADLSCVLPEVVVQNLPVASSLQYILADVLCR